MATVTYIRETRQHLSAMRAVMDYCMREDKTWDEQSGQRLISGINCDGMNAILEFEATKAAHGKMDGINFYQYVQYFKPTENITPRQAHEIAKEFAEKGDGRMRLQVSSKNGPAERLYRKLGFWTEEQRKYYKTEEC